MWGGSPEPPCFPSFLIELLFPSVDEYFVSPDCRRAMTQNAAETFPSIPTKLEETGLNIKFLSGLLFKSIYRLGLETNVEIASQLKLGQGIVDDLLGKLKQQGFMEIRGFNGSDSRVSRYSLTTAAKDLAIEAARQCEYVGPAPVPLVQYQNQVKKQMLCNEKISVDDISCCLSHLVLPSSIIRKLGPAVNSGRSLLIYGPPGNGKTSISEAIGHVFQQPVYIPHCIEVDGQVIRIFDATIHSEISVANAGEKGLTLLKNRPDPRWVKCRRPVVLTGGELTLKMLDLEYDETARFYEAPPQVKATGGVFIVDDFGRQMVQPQDLLNRWIIPLERRVDYLTIHTGKKFDVPFDELVIFSTNLPPGKLMDPGLMRRVKYKLRIDPPSVPDFVSIFRRVCREKDVALPQDLVTYLLEDFYPRNHAHLSAFHPAFIVEHAIATCRYLGIEPRLTIELAQDAMENLFLGETETEDALGSSADSGAATQQKMVLTPGQQSTAILSGIPEFSQDF
jgi:DNA-binding MarR family transcriptional regulator